VTGTSGLQVQPANSRAIVSRHHSEVHDMGWKERPAVCSEHSEWHSVRIASIWSASFGRLLCIVAVNGVESLDPWNRGKPNKKPAKERAISPYLRGCTPPFASKTVI
jgi:hypothetical protein